MASNQHRPKPRLSLRSNTTVPYGSMSSEQPDSDTPSVQITPISQRRSYIAVAVLCYINLLNYMDRYTIAGVLLSIQNYFDIRDSTSGLLQTVHMLCLEQRDSSLESLTRDFFWNWCARSRAHLPGSGPHDNFTTLEEWVLGNNFSPFTVFLAEDDTSPTQDPEPTQPAPRWTGQMPVPTTFMEPEPATDN